MRVVQPHDFFRADFDAILEEGKIQEELLAANKGEYALVKSMHDFFLTEVLPQIGLNDWVFKAAHQFALDYAADCFRLLRLTGDEIYRTQQRLLKLKDEVIDILAIGTIQGFVIGFGDSDLEKMSDFRQFIVDDRLSLEQRRKVDDLYNRTMDHEELHVLVALRSIRDHYEITLPRIMFVVRRAMKTSNKVSPVPSDNELSGISEYITWYLKYVPSNHALYPILGELKDFYKVARNVGNHHKGFSWMPEKNLVILEDKNTKIEMDVTIYLQKHRYLIHLCELGVRGILSAFCEREQGSQSNNLVKEYYKTFPENWTGGEKGAVQFFPENN